MSFAIRINLADRGTPAIRAVLQAVQPKQVNPIVGRAATNLIREHLFDLNKSRPNKLGGRRTNFYASAARGTHFDATENGVVISVVQVGIAQRYFGGIIKPTKAKYLTIPVSPEAHGKRASEFSDLEVVFGKGGRPIGLARKGAHEDLLYRLVKYVDQAADPTVLPSNETIAAAANVAVGSYVQRVIDRASGGAK